MGATATKIRVAVLLHCGEFSDYKEMYKALRKINRFLRIYYTHAYAAWEKGSVKNANRHIRRFYPKGTKFNQTTSQRIASKSFRTSSTPSQDHRGKDYPPMSRFFWVANVLFRLACNSPK